MLPGDAAAGGPPAGSAPAAGAAGCDAIRHDAVDRNGNVTANLTPSGYGPADIRSTYALGAASSGGRTVAIVDAYNDPNAEADLGVYRSTFGLPTCTTANGCFRKVDQSGGTSYPRSNGGWAQEISLDLDMVSAACPDCKILLVEASSASFANLGAGVNTAARLGATAISNSYGGSDSAQSSAYNHPASRSPRPPVTRATACSRRPRTERSSLWAARR